ncbi:polyprenyl diphosphate synthase [Acidihalobacter prosperus]
MQEDSTKQDYSPRHLAIVMDGNGRWARSRHLPRTEGHRRGVNSARTVIEACAEREIEVLTLFAFSSENWRRPRNEVNALMQLFISALRKEVNVLVKKGIRIRFIGDRGAFNEQLQIAMTEAEQRTLNNDVMDLVIAANYGGRWDIIQSAGKMIESRCDAAVTENRLAEGLSTAGLPDPDLFIRTGGERRLSNFLLWQLAYTELYFTDVLWPDFDAAALESALDDYRHRQRRFGQTGEQVEPGV